MRAGQVAEVIGRDRRGSGYLVRPDTVLTAAHVVVPGGTVRVRFSARTPIEVLEAHRVPNSDLALLKIDSLSGRESVAPGRIDEHRPEPVTVHFAGFPRWKYRQELRFRELHHGFGTVSALSSGNAVQFIVRQGSIRLGRDG